MAQQTLINGNRFSFVNLSVSANGADIPRGAITALNYNPTQEPGLVQGNLNVPTGRTQGYASATGSMEILLSEFNDFILGLTGGNPLVAFMDVDFDIVASYSVNDIDVVTDSLLGCRITNADASNAQGSDPTKRMVQLSIMRVYLNGVAAFLPPSDVGI